MSIYTPGPVPTDVNQLVTYVFNEFNKIVNSDEQGNLSLTAPNSAITGHGQLYLNGKIGNRIDFNDQGYAYPSYTTRSVGTKIVLWPSLSATMVDYAIGIGTDNLWLSVSDSTQWFSWYVGTTEVMYLNGTGGLGLTGNLTTNGQIVFPSTQNASTNVNTLDDYKEGTFNPVVTATAGTITSYTSSGSYVKVGKLVCFSFVATITNNGTGSGMVKITLPLTTGQVAAGVARENALNGYTNQIYASSGSTYALINRDNTYSGATNASFVGTFTYIANA